MLKLTYSFLDTKRNYSEEIEYNQSSDEEYILSFIFYDWYRELLSDYADELIKPVGYFKADSDLVVDFFNAVDSLLVERHKGEKIHIEGDVKKEPVSFDVEVPSMLHDFFDEDCQSENGTIIGDEFMIKCVEKFIDNGIWHFGFEDNSGKLIRYSKDSVSFDREKWLFEEYKEVFPILWFSLPYEGPVKYWNTSFLDDESRLAFNSLLHGDNDFLYEVIGEDSTAYCWIVECGMGISNDSKVLKKCPYKKLANCSSGNITKKEIDEIITKELRKSSASYVTVICQSEKTDSFDLRFGGEFYPVIDETVESFIKEELFDGTFEGRYELFVCEFEEDIERAIKMSKQNDISVRDALIATFGHFSFSYYVGEDYNFSVDIKKCRTIQTIQDFDDKILDLLETSSKGLL